jgi:hypothetical protein
MEGLQRRDRVVLGAAVANSIPVAIALAGGYNVDVRDTVAIHCNTARAALEVLESRQTDETSADEKMVS